MIKKSRETATMGQSSNRILVGSSIEGNIKSDGDFRIDGAIKGEIEIAGKLVIGEKGLVDGRVKCGSANISGKLKGNLTVDELLTLEPTARVEGEVSTAKLSIATGAEFSGSCNMGAVVREMQNNGKTNPNQAKKSEAS